MLKYKLRFITLITWLLLTVWAFFPSVIMNQRLYGRMRIVIYSLLLALFLSERAYRAINEKFFALIFRVLVFLGGMLLVFSAFNFRVSWPDYVNVFIVFVAMCAGYCFGITQKQLKISLFVYGAVALICGINTLYFFVGSFSLSEYMNVIETKNMTGQLVATCSIAFTIIPMSGKMKFVKIAFLLFSIVLSFLLRCRAAMAALMLFWLLFIWKKYDSKRFFILLFIALPFVAIYYSQIVSLFDQFFIGKLDYSDMDSLSTGRWHRNIEGIEFFLLHPIFGEMNTISGLQNIHNYLLRRLAAYGVFSFPFIIIYFAYLFGLLKQWFNSNVRDIRSIGAFMLIVPFFTSLLEPLSPFGPGLVQIIPFFYYGCFLQSYVPKKSYK